MNIFDKLNLPFAKKVKQVPVSWVEEGPEHYYVIHHLLFGYSDSTSVPNGYADIFSDAEVHDVLEKARQLIARAAIKKASTLAYLPCHADIDLKLLDLIHIAYTDGIQKSDLYRYDSQTFNIIISGETGELLCKYDES